jgi:hypothetical protein
LAHGDTGPVAAAAALGSPPSFGMSSSSDSDAPAPNLDIRNLVREVEQARSRYAATTVEINRLKENLWAIEVVRTTVEEAMAARADAADAQARAISGFCSKR